MAEEKNVKETKEVMVMFLQLAALLAVKFKDGVQVQDFAELAVKLMADEELKAKLLAAYNGVEQVPAELKDISVAEAFELVMAALPEVKALIGALK